MATDKMAADLDVDGYCLFIYTLEAEVVSMNLIVDEMLINII